MALSRYRNYATAVLAVLVSGALIGCSGAKRTPAEGSGATADASTRLQSDEGRTLSDGMVTVEVVDTAGYQKAIDAHRGSVVLVDYWATWCGPCIKQFPHTVELSEKYRDQGLKVIALSFDDADQIDLVRKFLADKEAKFDGLISKLSLDEFAEEFDFDGALPHYVVYDRNGKPVKHISPSDPTTTFRPELIDDAVEEQLAAKPAP